MDVISLKIWDNNGNTRAAVEAGPQALLVYGAAYEEGDTICVEVTRPGVWAEIRLDDSMLPAKVYLTETAVRFAIPFGEKASVYSPKSFYGTCHVLSARLLGDEEVYTRRNLALNPYDQHGDTHIYPHAVANVETRGEMAFAARNTIDGIYANLAHGRYPYHSWGINRQADAELKLELGAPATVDEVRLTLRADFPHDNYWTAATLEFSDGSREVVSLTKTALPQAFAIKPRVAEWVVLKELIQADEPSPFPALTQLEVWGTPEK